MRLARIIAKYLSICSCASFWGLAAHGGAFCDLAQGLLDGGTDVPVLGGVSCGRVNSADGKDQYFCALEHPFRSDMARDTYEKYVAEARVCFGDGAAVPVGPAVNHPDSYDQVVFDVNGRDISVSLKDKGALQKTYVFIRLPAN